MLNCLKIVFKNRGLTLIELVATMAILSILAAGILPLTKISYRRTKELELKQNLRTIRSALDRHHEMVQKGRIAATASGNGFPPTLEILVEGVDLVGPSAQKIKFLRRIPKDPMVEDGKWGLRSYVDEADSDVWGGQDVYDIYSNSKRQALDGSYYREW